MSGRAIALVTLVVPDYQPAIDWFTRLPGFRLPADIAQGPHKRWVVVGPEIGARLLLAKADGEAQTGVIGAQTGGRVAFFLETDDFARDHAVMLAAGVCFLEDPRTEAYGIVAVFEDICGNRWDLIQHAA